MHEKVPFLRRMLRFSLRGRIVLAFGLVLALLAVLTVLCLAALLRADRTVAQVSRMESDRVYLLGSLGHQTDALQDLARQQLGTSSPRDLGLIRARLVQVGQEIARERAQFPDLANGAAVSRVTAQEGAAHDTIANLWLAVLLVGDLALGLGLAVIVLTAGWLGRGLSDMVVAAERLADGLAEGEELALAQAAGGLGGRLSLAVGRLADHHTDIAAFGAAITQGDLRPRTLRRHDGDALGLTLEGTLSALEQQSLAREAGIAATSEDVQTGLHFVSAARTEALTMAQIAEETIDAVDLLLTKFGKIPLAASETLGRTILRQSESSCDRIQTGLLALEGTPLRFDTVHELCDEVAVLQEPGTRPGPSFSVLTGPGIAKLKRLAVRGQTAARQMSTELAEREALCRAAVKDLRALRSDMGRLAAQLSAARVETETQVEKTLEIADHLWRQNMSGSRGQSSLHQVEAVSGTVIAALQEMIAPERRPASVAPALELPPDPGVLLFPTRAARSEEPEWFCFNPPPLITYRAPKAGEGIRLNG
jgi:hypothetical protein